MAPRKPTTPQADNPHELILSYLMAQNRPYSSTEISANLHNKVTKTKADKFLKEMHEKNEIGGKIGKQSVFWALQVRFVY
jgi:26S proteasome regulatory subunit (ATPase 3-interacting protein)